MQHTIPLTQITAQIGLQAEEMAGAIETCVHCGFCLAVCPTYQVLGQEMDSPRGRIVLMKSVLEGELNLAEAMPYIDRCLGCLACVTACPSGVRYGELLSPFRAYARGQISAPLSRRVERALVESTLPYPKRFRSAATLGKLVKPFRKALPEKLERMVGLLPEQMPNDHYLPEIVPAEGKRRGRVALLAGCVQQVLDPHINWATVRILARNGVEVVIPKGQVCCGGLLLHTGDHQQARKLAQINLSAFPDDVDYILTNAAGCGSSMKEYPLLFKGLPQEEIANKFADKVRDISEYLAEIELLPTPPLARSMTAAYHDACHLVHAQGIAAEPRKVLGVIPNLTLIEIVDSTTCCGSAGTYNIEQPEIAAELGRRKAENILNSGAEAVVTGNIGCMVQIRTQLQIAGTPMPVFHTIELLDLAYSRAN